ncbi:ComEA family DNA-binding protein [Pseudomonas sp. NA-150]|uniref:ComEA family DNA-binding protein n=1 Tax=Pseudomonas sp. NA-150 TaxID=3367525 RepID=UPI0037CC994D
MRSAFLSSLLFAVFTTASVAVSAAPAAQPSAPAPVSAQAVMQADQSVKVNLNTADADTLQKQLSGIGSAKAQAIVAYREENGEFTSIDELLEVKGIGKAILEKNRDKVSIN